MKHSSLNVLTINLRSLGFRGQLSSHIPAVLAMSAHLSLLHAFQIPKQTWWICPQKPLPPGTEFQGNWEGCNKLRCALAMIETSSTLFTLSDNKLAPDVMIHAGIIA
jgi:hypothetical protein